MGERTSASKNKIKFETKIKYTNETLIISIIRNHFYYYIKRTTA